MKLLFKILISIVIITFVFYQLWRPPVMINLVVETSQYGSIDMNVNFDNKSVFNDSVKAGTYKRSTIKLEGVPPGFHKLEIKSNLGGATYSKNVFILFKRTMIFEYFKEGQGIDIPYFRSRTIKGRFYPD